MACFRKCNIKLSGILVIGAIALFSSCNKYNGKGSREVVKDDRTEEIGLVFPEIRSQEGDTIKLALYPHAQFFFIDRELKGSEELIKLIKNANKEDVPVRVSVFEKNRAEVASIIPATKEEIKKIRNH